MFLTRKNSTKANDIPVPANGTTAAVAAPVISITIPDTAASKDPMPIASLIPRDITLKSVSATEVTVEYSLPPTCTSVGGPVDVRIVLRPSKLYKSTMAQETMLRTQLRKMQMDYNMNNAKNMSKPGYNVHEAFVAFTQQLRPINEEIARLWDQYTKKCHELLPLEPEKKPASSVDGFYVANLDKNWFEPVTSYIEKEPVSVKSSPEKNIVTIRNLASNIFFEIALAATRANASAENVSTIWSPLSDVTGFSTKTAPWQIALEKAGLRNLIEPFAENGLDTFPEWLSISQNLKEQLGIDAATDQVLGEILAQNGIITPAEQAKVDRDRAEMVGVVNTLLSDLKASISTFGVGDAVLEKVASNKKRGPQFGVIVSVTGDKCSVRWEDPRTKDPANSSVENDVKVSSVVRSNFTLFMSHAQADAQNQVAHLTVLLRDRDAKVWFDMDSERLEAKDMVRGIANTKVFLLYLTQSYFDRYFCRMEVSIAKALNKTLIIVFEPDERHGGTSDYVKLVNRCTIKYPEFREYLLSTEAIPMARRAFQRRAVVDEICKRAGVISRSGSFIETNGKGDSSAAAAAGAGAMELSDLRQMILDLKMEMNDLKEENKELRETVEGLQQQQQSSTN